ncbi:MAG: glycosyltransferase family 87 protein [Xanthobacteraceae bacterium]
MIRHLTSPTGSGIPFPARVELVCFALIVAQAVFLVAMYGHGLWLVRPDGSIQPSDFTYFWTAGRQVLAGQAAIGCGPELTAAGNPLQAHLPFFYPPTFLFVVTALALSPYVAAYLGWVFATFALYVAAIRSIVGHRIGAMLACAFPGLLADFMSGQNGFLTAALLAGSLGLMERKPVLAGCFLGLLSYKPQLGILFPLVLVISGQWRMLFAAAATAALLAAMSWLAFGLGSWEAFVRCLPEYSRIHLTSNGDHWAKMQSVFAVVRLLGGSEGLASAVHGSFLAVIALTLAVLWRSPVSFAMKAAALALGALLATPTLFLYDMVALAVPMAFLLQEGRRTGFLPHEMLGIGVACLLILIFPAVMGPVGLAAALVTALLIGRRAWAQRSGAITHLITSPAVP